MATTKYFTAEPEINLNAAHPSQNPTYTLAYRTLGSPSNPAILMPTCYTGTLEGTLPILWDPSQSPIQPPVLSNYYVILVGLLGGSESSSPSNAPTQLSGSRFPKQITYETNIRLQHALCTALGVSKLAAYIGFSMGGQQAYHFATLYPDFVERAVVLASSARTSWHNWCFLEGPKAALVNSEDWCNGEYTKPVIKGCRAFSRVYSTWALSQGWFRARCWEQRGFASLEAYLEENWSGKGRDAWDLLCMMDTWQQGDISLHGPGGKGDLAGALGSIQAKVLVMPCRTDCYFPPEDSEEEVKHLKKGELSIIESVWGHLAGGGGGTEEDNRFICKEIERWLAQ